MILLVKPSVSSCMQGFVVGLLVLVTGCDGRGEIPAKVPPEDLVVQEPESLAPEKVPESIGSEPAKSMIMVEVQGAVVRPGVYRFEQEDRVQNALTRAGGALAEAEIRDLNLAARLVDASVLTVPIAQQPHSAQEPTAAQLNPAHYTRSGWAGAKTSPSDPGYSESPAASGGCVNLNTATKAELETLPGVGPKTAEKIVQYREQQPFAAVSDLTRIRGVGDAKLEAMRALVCVD